MILKTKLLVDYDQYREFNGFVKPIITSEDIEYGLDTIEKKFEAWSRYTQTILNAILQEELDNIEYDITKVKPAYQHSLINIITMRLIRAFYNDELIPRDSQVQLSQQGGIQYSSAAALDSKSSLYSFFNGNERALIESSGLTTDIFVWNTEDDDDIVAADGTFKDGIKVEDVNWNDKQNTGIVIAGRNTSVTQAINDLYNDKANVGDIANIITRDLGLRVEHGNELISSFPISYGAKISNKRDNQLAQYIDVKESEARSKNITDSLSAKVNNTKALVKTIKGEIDFINNLELLKTLIDLNDHDTNFDANNHATIDLKTIMIDDPDNVGNKIRLFPDKVFVDGAYVTVELEDKTQLDGGIAVTHSFVITKQAIYDMNDYSITVTLDKQGILSLTNTTVGKDVSNLIVSAISISSGQVTGVESAALKALIKHNVSKQLNQGAAADFETYSGLKSLLLDDDFTSISLANGDLVTGRVTNIDDHNITISGMYVEHGTNVTKIGNIKFDKPVVVGGPDDGSFTTTYEKTVYTIAEAEKIFARRIYDYSDVGRDLTAQAGQGANFQIIDQPAILNNAEVGTEVKLLINAPAIPANLPADGDYLTFGIESIYINAANNDRMSWAEAKDHINKGEILILKKSKSPVPQIGEYWLLVKWEAPVAVGGGLGADWIDKESVIVESIAPVRTFTANDLDPVSNSIAISGYLNADIAGANSEDIIIMKYPSNLTDSLDLTVHQFFVNDSFQDLSNAEYTHSFIDHKSGKILVWRAAGLAANFSGKYLYEVGKPDVKIPIKELKIRSRLAAAENGKKYILKAKAKV